MIVPACAPESLAPETLAFYRRAVQLLKQTGLPFLTGGAYALHYYTGIVRHTKDLDLFVRPEDCQRVLDCFAEAGYAVQLTFPHWLGKVYHADDFIDVIFSSGNGLVRVDDAWFARALSAEVLGETMLLCPAEEMIWSKGFIMERERFDGADIAHLIRARGRHLDWTHLLERFGPHWRVLLTHLVLFDFIYPSERSQVPDWIVKELLARVEHERQAPPPPGRLCRGTLLSREQYLIDLEQWGYHDPRLRPEGTMSAEDIQQWTDAIGSGK